MSPCLYEVTVLWPFGRLFHDPGGQHKWQAGGNRSLEHVRFLRPQISFWKKYGETFLDMLGCSPSLIAHVLLLLLSSLGANAVHKRLLSFLVHPPKKHCQFSNVMFTSTAKTVQKCELLVFKYQSRLPSPVTQWRWNIQVSIASTSLVSLLLLLPAMRLGLVITARVSSQLCSIFQHIQARSEMIVTEGQRCSMVFVPFLTLLWKIRTNDWLANWRCCYTNTTWRKAPPLYIQNISWLPLTAFPQICSVRTLPILFCKVMIFSLHHPPGYKLPNNSSATIRTTNKKHMKKKKPKENLHISVDFLFWANVRILCLKKRHRLTMPNPPLHPEQTPSLENGIPLSIAGEFWKKMNQAKNKKTGVDQKYTYIIYIYIYIWIYIQTIHINREDNLSPGNLQQEYPGFRWDLSSGNWAAILPKLETSSSRSSKG